MSMTDTIVAARPKADDSVSLTEAIDRAELMITEKEQEAADLAAARDGLLLTGDPVAIDTVTKRYADAVESARSLHTMAAAMRVRLDNAVDRECGQISELKNRHAKLCPKVEDHVRRWNHQYVEHADAIRELLLERKNLIAEVSAFNKSRVLADSSGNPHAYAYDFSIPETRALVGNGTRSMADLVSLPSVNGGPYIAHDPAIWLTDSMHRRLYPLNDR